MVRWLAIAAVLSAAASPAAQRPSVPQNPAGNPCPEIDPSLRAGAQAAVNNAIELKLGGLLQYSDSTSLRAVTNGKDCETLNNLVDPDYSVSADPPAFFVNYFHVDAVDPSSGPVTLSIAILSRNREVSTIDGPGVFLLYVPAAGDQLQLIETFLSS